MDISAGFATTLDSVEHIVIAEELGYRRAWCYDTPQQSPDVWMALALAAQRTSRIGLGPGVLIPTLRHPMVNAAGAAALSTLAPGRVAVGFGTGFTGRRAMGEKKPIPWSYVAAYVRTFRALLRGATVTWQGAALRMLHPAGSIAERPLEIPVVIGALGPKGQAVARELGDGLFVTTTVPEGASDFSWVPYLCWGTVLEEGEDWSDDRVVAAGGPGAVLAYHATYELTGREAVLELPGGKQWLDAVDRTPEAERHLSVHNQHCVGLSDADRAGWSAGGHALLDAVTLTGTPTVVREKLERLQESGVTEVVYQPAGPDIPRELAAFAKAAGT